LKEICINSIDSILNYDYLKKNPINKNIFNNKIILILYNSNKPIAFNCIIKLESNVYHLGLYMIIKEYKGYGIQKKLSIINTLPLHNYNIFKNIIITDIGNSSSAVNILSKYIYDLYPNFIYNISIKDYHKKYAKLLFEKYKKEICLSNKSEFNENTFIVKNANIEDGAIELTNFINDRITKNKKINEYFEKNIGKYDEIIIVGKYNLAFLFISLLFSKKILSIINY